MIEEPYRWVEAIANRREYIEDQLRLGSPVVALDYDKGLLLLTVSRETRKVFEVYDRVAFAALGHPADIERMRLVAIALLFVFYRGAQWARLEMVEWLLTTLLPYVAIAVLAIAVFVVAGPVVAGPRRERAGGLVREALRELTASGQVRDRLGASDGVAGAAAGAQAARDQAQGAAALLCGSLTRLQQTHQPALPGTLDIGGYDPLFVR